jgi:acetyl/propionyl-CoA carboxylase alpha subunit
MKKLKKLFVLNRGEIACRIIQAAQELGLSTVAIASEADKNLRHITLADSAVILPGITPRETYLNLEALLEVAKENGCDSVHPGYGFLSERASAAEAFLAAGIQWIGPSPKSIRLLGDKVEAKKLLQKHQVPTTPWGEVNLKDPESLSTLASSVGYPLLLKASAGGGGKGMRLVTSAKDLLSAAAAASREAESAFGDGTLFLEKLIEKPRHVEIQILGDHFGNVIHFGERECSLQRRHQKVIEEAPATNLRSNTKEEMAEAALKLARGVGYASAGTVEFLVDAQEKFYFLEVNSRLQVEHSVTEAVWGMDLVQAQIKIADGASLDELFPDPSARKPRGHSIQARIYAEDCAHGFLPQPGPLPLVEWPNGVGLRIDTAISSGAEITPHYDPMIAKITALGENREQARTRLLWALRNTVLFGTTTNVNFLQDLLAHPQFSQHTVHVKWIEETFSPWKDPLPSHLNESMKEILTKAKSAHATNLAINKEGGAIPSPWEKSGGIS